MDIPLRVLIIEDSDRDVALEVRALKAAGYEVTYAVADTAAAMEAALNKQAFDIVISDNDMPQFDAQGALVVLKQSGLDIPFIIVSGAIGEETAVALMKAGAHDYVMKDKLARLIPAVQRELREAESRRERKREDQAQVRLVAMLDATPGFVGYADAKDTHLLYINTAGRKMVGVQAQEDVTPLKIADVHPEWTNKLFRDEIIPTAIRDGLWTGECAFLNRDGHEIPVMMALLAHKSPSGEVERFSTISIDITDRKRAAEDLKESENNYRLLANNINDVIFVLDMNLNYTYASPSLKFLLGYEPESILKQPAVDKVTPSSWDLAMRTISEVMELEKSEHRELHISRTLQLEMIRKDRTTVWTEVKFSFFRDEKKEPVGILGVIRDITERRLVEEELRVSENLFRNYLENAPDGIYMSDLQGTFLYGNRRCEEIIGYRREELIGRNFLEFNLLSENSLNKVAQLLQANMEGKSTGPDEIDLINKEGRLIPVEINTNVIQRIGQRIVIASVRDITERKRAEEQLRQTLESLRKAFGATIQAMVSAVESRDPYTSGHQIRSADLARAIATEMGLHQEKIDGIHIAGSIHDIGKLSIPAEILSKPKKLTEIEFSLIKEHSRGGYEMLKDVESPWPLAEIVYQHHERMDGSGYPRNLKGDDILIEARILAVSDVVESMASHRPYRPALGLNAALDEIEKNSGTHYDNTVVNACIRLFREKGYQL